MTYRIRWNKYGAKKQEYKGVVYHSKKEAGVAHRLNMLKASGEIIDFQRQVKIDLRVNDKHITNYYIDFVIQHNDGRVEYLEVKGCETDLWRLKWKMFEAIYGDDKNNILMVEK